MKQRRQTKANTRRTFPTNGSPHRLVSIILFAQNCKNKSDSFLRGREPGGVFQYFHRGGQKVEGDCKISAACHLKNSICLDIAVWVITEMLYAHAARDDVCMVELERGFY
jgi:hypothetical protein